MARKIRRNGKEYFQFNIESLLVGSIFFLIFGGYTLYSSFTSFKTFFGHLIYIVAILTPIIIGFIIYAKRKWSRSITLTSELGICECSTGLHNGNYGILIYYEKLANLEFSLSNVFEQIENMTKSKYSKLLFLTTKKQNINTKETINNLFYIIKSNFSKIFILSDFVKENSLNYEVLDLSRKQSAININQANISELTNLPFLNKQKAVEIKLHIQKHGEFDNIWEFANFIDYPQDKLKLLFKYVYVEKSINKEIPFPQKTTLEGDNVNTRILDI